MNGSFNSGGHFHYRLQSINCDDNEVTSKSTLNAVPVDAVESFLEVKEEYLK